MGADNDVRYLHAKEGLFEEIEVTEEALGRLGAPRPPEGTTLAKGGAFSLVVVVLLLP